MFNSSWPPPRPEDPRWETMQYHLQVHLLSIEEELERLRSEDVAE